MKHGVMGVAKRWQVLAEDNIEAISVVAGSMNMANETLSYLLSTHFFLTNSTQPIKTTKATRKAAMTMKTKKKKRKKTKKAGKMMTMLMRR